MIREDWHKQYRKQKQRAIAISLAIPIEEQLYRQNKCNFKERPYMKRLLKQEIEEWQKVEELAKYDWSQEI